MLTDDTTPTDGRSATFDVRCPANGRVVASLPDTDAAAVAATAGALRAVQPQWEAIGPDARARHLLDWLDWILDNESRILALVQEESGKSAGDTTIETMVAVEVINYYAKNARRFLADRSVRGHNPAALAKQLSVRVRPHPLVGIIFPWNYPLGMPMMDVPPALIAGAAVLTKPSEFTPIAWTECVRGFREEIGAPAVLASVTGGGPTGSAVVEAVDMVTFTGSARTGRKIAIRAAERMIPCNLELGGKDPMIVLDDANLDRAVNGAIWGGLFNAGQACISVERIYVEAPVYDRFVERLTEKASALRVGMDRAGSWENDFGALANEAQMEIVERHVRDAVEKGARITTGGVRAGHGLFYPATVITDADHSMVCMREETFGPTLPVMRVRDEDEAVRLANDSTYGLSSSVWSTNPERAERVARRIESGAVNINNAAANAFQFPLPFGGWKESGTGTRFGGAAGLLKYCREQAVCAERFDLDTELHWYPYTKPRGELFGRAVRLLGARGWRRKLGRKGRTTTATTARRATMDATPRAAPAEAVDDATPSAAPTVCGAFQRLVALHPDKPALRTFGRDDARTWAELDAEVRRVAGGLAVAGIGHGDTLAMMLTNVPECHVVDFAATHLGAVPFAIYNSSAPEQIEYQLGDAASRVIVTEQAFLPQVLDAAQQTPSLETVVVVDGEADGAITLDDLCARADAAFDFDAAWKAVGPEDLVTLIYTSGTTGPPKGALWAHRTAMSQLRALGAVMPVAQDAIVSFLPMAHAGGRIAAHYMALPHGATIVCCPALEQMPAALADGRPDAIFTVPRVWEKLRAGIEAMVGGLPDDAREQAQATIAAGVARAEAGESPEPPSPLLLPILQRLGLDRMRVAFIGGAPSAPELSHFFRAVGVPLLEAYGSTETGLNVFNRIEEFRAGTAGKPLPGVEARIADDGELLVRAPLNMVGYHARPEQTAETIDDDGWLRTGDIATIDDDGFVSIVDRKKDIIINAAGKNMSPANIEAAIKPESPLIGQVATIGDGRRYVTALVVLDPEGAPAFARERGLEAGGVAELAAHADVQAEVAAAIERGNQRLSRVEQVKKHTLLPVVWGPDSDEMTATMKLKRRLISAKYADEIDALYAE